MAGRPRGRGLAPAFGYTPAGRLSSRGVSLAAYQFLPGLAQTRSYASTSRPGEAADVVDQYETIAVTGSGPKTLVHDPRGNLLSDGARTLTHDFENRLESLTPISGSAIAYDYDPSGRRVTDEPHCWH